MEEAKPVQIKLVYKKASDDSPISCEICTHNINAENAAASMVDILIQDSGSILAFSDASLSNIQELSLFDNEGSRWDKKGPVYLLQINTTDGEPNWVGEETKTLLGQGEHVVIQYYYKELFNNTIHDFSGGWSEAVKSASATKQLSTNNVYSERALLDRQSEEAKSRYKAAWLVAFFAPQRIFSWLNPANGIALAMLAIFIGAVISFAWPSIVAAAAFPLMSIASIGLVFAAVTIIPFTIWEAVKHYQAWKHTNTSRPIQKSYGQYLLDLFEQMNKWRKEHFLQAAAIIVGLVVAALCLGLGVGFIEQNSLLVSSLSPVFDAIKAVLSPGLGALSHLPGLSFLADIITPLGLNIIATVLLTILPLALVNLGSRIAQTDHEARQAGGQLVGGEGEGFDPWNPQPPEHDMDLKMWNMLDVKCNGSVFYEIPKSIVMAPKNALAFLSKSCCGE